MSKPDIVCVACASRFFAGRIVFCQECQEPCCPICGVHAQMAQLGVFDVPPYWVASVKAQFPAVLN